MKARVILIAAALTALTLLSEGCKKHSFWSPTPGTPITFRMKSNMENPVETKTVYNDNGGEYFVIDGRKYEGIDWEVGDKLSIGYVSAETGTPIAEYAEYQISEVTGTSAISGSQVISTGKAVPSGEGLHWRGGNYHEFYTTTLPPGFDIKDTDSFKFEMKYDSRIDGYYPDSYLPYYYPYSFSASDSAFMTKNADGSYCENMKYAYIYSINNGRMIPKYGDIELTLTPHFTAFEITATARQGDVVPVNSFTLSCGNAYIAGEIPYITYIRSYEEDSEEKYEWRWKNLSDDSSKDVSSKVTIDFSGENIVLHNNGSDDFNQLKFTFFVKDEWMNRLRLTFNIKKDGVNVNRSLRLTYGHDTARDSDWIGFSSSYKHRIYGLQIPLEADAVWFEGADAGEFEFVDWDF